MITPGEEGCAVAETGPRFCPRCGTARMGDMAFCPNCGLDLRDLPRDAGVAAAAVTATPADAAAPSQPPLAPVLPPAAPQGEGERRREPSVWGSLVPALILIAILALIAAWLGGIGPFARGADGSPGPGILPVATPSPTSPFLPPVTAAPSFSVGPGFTAPPVGLTILSPADGAVVGSQDLTVIGSAPAGLTITQDISFGLDRHATVDGTGHWAIQVQLSDGENRLTFRIGDDASTSQTIRVIYIPPAS
jgi:hypothetical protein